MDSKTHNAIENVRVTFRGAASVGMGALRDSAVKELAAIDGSAGSAEQVASVVRGAAKALRAGGTVVR